MYAEEQMFVQLYITLISPIGPKHLCKSKQYWNKKWIYANQDMFISYVCVILTNSISLD